MIGRLLAFCLLLCAYGGALAQETRPLPEAATGITAKTLTVAKRHMVVAAHPLAAEAGREILRRGGSAIDAAIATQLVLGLVEPQSSGLGGGAFIVVWDAAGKAVKTYDGRETAPASAAADRFVRDGQPLPFDDAVRSGLSVGVPGAMRALELAHRAHGRLPWADLFAPAIALAENGFALQGRLFKLLSLEAAERFAPGARAYFYGEDGRVKPEGTILRNAEYAATLKATAAVGAQALHEGPIAEAIVAAVAAAPIAKGDLTLADLSRYQAQERPAVCSDYRAHKICGMGPPSSGALTVAQTLKLIEPLSGVQGAASRMSAEAIHAISEAEKLSFADRNRYIGDPDFVAVPGGLLDSDYLAARRRAIDPLRAMAKPEAGLPPGLAKRSFGIDATRELAGTSHLSIIDDQGNAVAMTTTIESAFGSHLWAAGFLLNNQLTDFSFVPTDATGARMANAVEGGKRPRSSMAPTLIFDSDGRLQGVTGSPGGSRIILFVVKTLVAMLDWGLDPQAAAALPNFGSEGGPLLVESDNDASFPIEKLSGLGHVLKPDMMTSGMHTIMRRGDVLEGGADPRRDGVALGD